MTSRARFGEAGGDDAPCSDALSTALDDRTVVDGRQLRVEPSGGLRGPDRLRS